MEVDSQTFFTCLHSLSKLHFLANSTLTAQATITTSHAMNLLENDAVSHLFRMRTRVRKRMMQKIGTTSPASLKAELAEAVMERSQASGVDSSFELESESESDFEFEIDEVNETAAASTKKCDSQSKKKASRKEAKRLAKTLRKLLTKVETALDRSAAQGKDLEHRAEAMAANRDEVEKVMREHVKHLHSLIDHHHQLHRDMLRQRHKQCLEQLLATHVESQNYDARLVDLRNRAQDTLKTVTESSDASACKGVDVTPMHTEFATISAKKPGVQEAKVTYTAEVSKLEAQVVADLIGRFVISEQISPPAQGQSSPLPSQTSDKQDVSAPVSTSISDPSTPAFSVQAPCEPATSPAPDASGAKMAAPTSQVSQQTSASGGAKPKSPSKASPAKISPPVSKETPAAAAAYPPRSLTSPSPSVSTTKRSGAVEAAGSVTSPREEEMRRLLKPLLAQNAVARRRRPDGQTLTMAYGSYSQVVSRLQSQVALIAPAKGNKAWILYGKGKPRLDLIDHVGNVVSSSRLDSMPSHVAAIGKGHALVSFCSRQKLALLQDGTVLCSMPLMEHLHLTSISVGSTGIAVSFTNSLYWFGVGNEKDVWIIPQKKKSKLTGICSTAVLTLDGTELVLAAVRGTQEVVIFEKEQSHFTALPSFKGRDYLHAQFSPLCISAHPSGFVAVLDSQSGDVVMLNVRTLEMESIIPGGRLCVDVPAVIAFGQDDTKGRIYLWVCCTSGLVHRVPLSCYSP